MVCGDAELDMRALLSSAGVGYTVTWCYLYKQAWYAGFASDPTVGLAPKTEGVGQCRVWDPVTISLRPGPHVQKT